MKTGKSLKFAGVSVFFGLILMGCGGSSDGGVESVGAGTVASTTPPVPPPAEPAPGATSSVGKTTDEGTVQVNPDVWASFTQRPTLVSVAGLQGVVEAQSASNNVLIAATQAQELFNAVCSRAAGTYVVTGQFRGPAVDLTGEVVINSACEASATMEGETAGQTSFAAYRLTGAMSLTGRLGLQLDGGAYSPDMNPEGIYALATVDIDAGNIHSGNLGNKVYWTAVKK